MDQNYQNLTDTEKELQITEELNWLLQFQLRINQYIKKGYEVKNY